MLPTACHRCDISSNGDVLLGRNDAEMGPANSLHASAYYSEYNERFDLSMKTTVNKFYQATRNVDCRLFVEIKLLYANCSLTPEEHYSEAVMARISGINSSMLNVTLYSAKYFLFLQPRQKIFIIFTVFVLACRLSMEDQVFIACLRFSTTN